MQKETDKYTLKEKLAIAESISTILMFLMAIWGTLIAYEEGFWHKLNHIVNHYHTVIAKIEKSQALDTLEINKLDKTEH